MVAIPQSAAPPPVALLFFALHFIIAVSIFGFACIIALHAPQPKNPTELLHLGLLWVASQPKNATESVAFGLALGVPQPKKATEVVAFGPWLGAPQPKKPSGIVGQIGFGVTPTNPKPQYALCLGYPQAKQYCSSLLTLGWGDCNATQSTPPLGWGDCNATQATHPLGLGQLQRQTCSLPLLLHLFI